MNSKKHNHFEKHGEITCNFFIFIFFGIMKIARGIKIIFFIIKIINLCLLNQSPFFYKPHMQRRGKCLNGI